MKSLISNFLLLTKPRVMLLVIFSGLTTLFMLILGYENNTSYFDSLWMKESLFSTMLKFILILSALYLTGGSANALNQYFEREIDSKMSRTKKRRPLPQGKITPRQALIFSISIGILGVFILVLFFNLLSALIALGTILFYSLFYTLWLKPNTPQNIVIGGIAGAMPPLIAWAAATNSLFQSPPWILFLIIFFWTPPHFWALALYFKDDYKETNLPMLPVVKGNDFTLKQIFYYTLVLVGVTLTMFAAQANWLYLVVAVVLGAIFIKKSYEAKKYKSRKLQKGLFVYSLIYLFTLMFTIIIDGYLF